MKKLLTFFFLFPTLCLSQTMYKIHHCEKKERCIDPNAPVLSFKVDVVNDKVLIQLHENNNQITKVVIMNGKECNVFDPLNWICKKDSLITPNCPWVEYKMSSGNLSYAEFINSDCNKQARAFNKSVGIRVYKSWWTENI